MTPVTVLKQDGTPAHPTVRGGRVRYLLKTGKARVIRTKPFTIRLLYDTGETGEGETLGIDPGRTNIGLASVRDDGTCTLRMHAETRNKEVPRLMQERAGHRRKHRDNGRRDVRQRRAKAAGTESPRGIISRKLPRCKKLVPCRGIRNKKARFSNRRRPEGWLTPTAGQLLQTHLSAVDTAVKMRPVKRIVVELNKFAFMALDNPDIKKEDYALGPLHGYDGLHDAVSAQQDGHCLMCGNGIDHYHHLVPRRKGGSDTIDNMAGLCTKCHDRIHKDAAFEADVRRVRAGLNKKYGALSVLNQIIRPLMKELKARYPDMEICVTTGGRTKAFRDKAGIAKDHDTDAYCIACSSLENPKVDSEQVEDIDTLEIRQFRRHDRMACHKEMVDRKYYRDGKCVCMNRHKRTEQKTDSLEEYRATRPDVSDLTVPPHPPQYKDPDRILPGAVMRYRSRPSKKGGHQPYETVFVMQRSDGRHDGHPDYYVDTKGRKYRYSRCEVLQRNTGLVFV